MKITLSLDDKLVKEVRQIAVERDTTLTGLIRAHLEELARESARVKTKAQGACSLGAHFHSFPISHR